jgi:hypothetical protein
MGTPRFKDSLAPHTNTITETSNRVNGELRLPN